MHWSDIEEAQPRLAGLSRERLVGPGVVLVGTIRRDGTPRISPVEPYLLDGDLWLSMLWQSTKARDLLRGTARAGDDPGVQRRYAAAVAADLGWNSQPGRFHLFAVDFSEIVLIRYDPDGSGDQTVVSWPPGREFIRRGTSATSVGEPEPASGILQAR
jgi:hypothetical protein